MFLCKLSSIGRVILIMLKPSRKKLLIFLYFIYSPNWFLKHQWHTCITKLVGMFGCFWNRICQAGCGASCTWPPCRSISYSAAQNFQGSHGCRMLQGSHWLKLPVHLFGTLWDSTMIIWPKPQAWNETNSFARSQKAQILCAKLSKLLESMVLNPLYHIILF